jgi:flagellar biosynthesis protein FlhG
MRALPELLVDGPARLASELTGLEEGADYVIVDAGSGLGPGIATLAAAADEVVVVTTPEPTSVADAHATIGRLKRLTAVPLRVAVNQAVSVHEANDVLSRLCATSRQFLGAVVTPLGHVRRDPHVATAVRARQPFVLAYPNCAASRDIRRIARNLSVGRPPGTRRPGFFATLAARWGPGRLAH